MARLRLSCILRSRDRAGGPCYALRISCSRCRTHSSTPTNAVRIPNGALASLAGNLDHHHVAIADLVLAQSSVRRTIGNDRSSPPDLVGLSVMTFQRVTAPRHCPDSLGRCRRRRRLRSKLSASAAHPDLGVDAIVGAKARDFGSWFAMEIGDRLAASPVIVPAATVPQDAASRSGADSMA